jgi:hypothetical protein
MSRDSRIFSLREARNDDEKPQSFARAERKVGKLCGGAPIVLFLLYREGYDIGTLEQAVASFLGRFLVFLSTDAICSSGGREKWL